MYTIVKALLVSVALLFASSTESHAQRYDDLWKEVRQFEKEGLPKSATETVAKIARKAVNDSNKGQHMAAFLYGCVLRQQITPDSFYTDVLKLERMKTNTKDVVLRSIYASILGELYGRGVRMTHNYSEKTDAHPDSIHEWSVQQFRKASSMNYDLSMADVLSLAKVCSDIYMPFVKKGDDADYFNDDLLHVIAKRAILSKNGTDVEACKERKNFYNQVLTTYRQLGNRNAELLFMLDSIADCTQYTSFYDERIGEQPNMLERERKALASDTYKALETMRLRFADLPTVAEVYLRMSALDVTPQLKVKWLEEACTRYPSYPRITALKNKLRELQQPMFCMQIPEVVCPDDMMNCQVRHRHLNNGGAGLVWYRMPEHVSYDSLSANISKPEFADFLKREAILVRKDSLKWRNALPYEELTDTFCLQTPDAGLYVLSADVRGITSKNKSFFHIVTVTRLMPIVMEHPDTAVYCRVVDRTTGMPIENVFVQLFKAGEVLSSDYTDAEGKVLLGEGNRKVRTGGLYVLAKKGEDVGHPRIYLYGRYSYHENQSTENIERLFTDRSVYRPGQVVQVGGLCTTYSHMDEKVNPYHTVVLTLYDANHRKVSDVTTVSDEMGKISAVFKLPSKGLNGVYRIRSEKGYVTFQVAEYKRPTFKVVLDALEDFRQSGDTVYVSGKADNYNGTPLRYARVVMDCSVVRRFYYNGVTDAVPVRDTVYTDANGRFELPLNSGQASSYPVSYYKKVHVTITNAVGESQVGQVMLPVGREKISLTVNAPSKWMKTALPTIDAQVTNLVGVPLLQDVNLSYRIFSAKKGSKTGVCLMNDTLSANVPICLTVMEKMPSGGYYLEVTALHHHDTTTVGIPFILFDISDVRPADECDMWLNVVQNKISATDSGHVQVGSSRKDVTLYCQMFCQKQMVSDTLLHFSDSILNLVYPVEKVEGEGAYLLYYFVQGGKVYMQSVTLEKVRDEKILKMKWTSFRDHLQPGTKETWTLKVSTPDGKPASAQLMATLYDASLEGIAPHHWQLNNYNHFSLPYVWPDTYPENHYFRCLYAKLQLPTIKPLNYSAFDENMLKWNGNQIDMVGGLMWAPRLTAKSAKGVRQDKEVVTNGPAFEVAGNGVVQEDALEEKDDVADVQIRENLNETAFFYPVLTTDKQGDVSISFTLPEALTTWRFMALAHTEDMRVATFTDEVVAAKEVMAQLHLPRFVRRNDTAILSATLYNLTQKEMKGKVLIEVIEPETEKTIWSEKRETSLAANSDSFVEFMFPSDEMPSLVICRVRLETDGHSDGEQRYMPILDHVEWVTQTLPFIVDKKGETEVDLSSLYQGNHEMATHRRLTLEYTANPLWYAVQALPSIQELRANDVLSLASAYFSTTMTQSLLLQNPEIKEVIQSWQQSSDMKSSLEQHKELSGILLEETPWVTEAEADKQRMQKLGLLLDDNYQQDIRRRCGEALGKLQNKDGSFSWYPGMCGNRYITMRIAEMLAKCANTDVSHEGVDVGQMMNYLAGVVARQLKEYKALRIRSEKTYFPAEEWLNYMYVVTALDGFGLNEVAKKEADEVLSCLMDTMNALPLSHKAKMAVVLCKKGENIEANRMLRSIKEHLVSTNQGVSLQYPSNGFVSAERKIEEHVAVMEAMHLCGENNQKLMNGLLRWLMSQKRVQDWGGASTTLEAINAMATVCTPDATKGMCDKLSIKNGWGKTILSVSSSDTEWRGLGYVIESTDERLNHGLKKLRVNKKDDSMAWGALYAQYRLPMAEVERTSEGMSVRCELDSTHLEIGDRINLRFLLSADKDYEFVCFKIGRAACLEPTDAISGYGYMNGLGYYKEVKDASINYYFDVLPKGTYVLEMECYVERAGTYRMGNMKMNCVYAPEFSAIAEGKELNVEP